MESDPNARLPYFTLLLDRLDKNDPELTEAFGRHVHWGYWDSPELADGTARDFAAATERLSRRICNAAGIKSDIRVLDVGCGFGGTIASLNERIAPLALTGLNIDERQLERARKIVRANPQNQIDFVEGDACALPFDDASFEVVLAVECVFHFPSRIDFWHEARRVLTPGGRLAITDFVATGKIPDPPIVPEVAARVERFYGPGSVVTLADYHALAERSGLRITNVDDLTRGMAPSWPFAQRVLGGLSDDAPFATALLEQQAREDIARYLIITFEGG